MANYTSFITRLLWLCWNSALVLGRYRFWSRYRTIGIRFLKSQAFEFSKYRFNKITIMNLVPFITILSRCQLIEIPWPHGKDERERYLALSNGIRSLLLLLYLEDWRVVCFERKFGEEDEFRVSEGSDLKTKCFFALLHCRGAKKTCFFQNQKLVFCFFWFYCFFWFLVFVF